MFLLWAPRETLSPSPPSPHPCFSSPGPASSPPEELHLRSTLGPTLGQRDSPPGPVRGHETPGQDSWDRPGAGKSVSCSARRRVLSGPALGRRASGKAETVSGRRGFRLGFGSRTQRKQSLGWCRAPRQDQSAARVCGWVGCGGGGELLTVEKNSVNPNPCSPSRLRPASWSPRIFNRLLVYHH